MDGTDTEAQRPLNIEFIVDWARRWLAGWNAHDVEGLVSMCHRDVVWDDPALPQTVYGHEGVRGFLRAIFETFPDLQIETSEGIFLTMGPRALGPYRLTGTMLGNWEPTGLTATGRRFAYRGIDEWEFRDGQLCRYNTHYDSLDAARQLGLLAQFASREA
jgi:steroid delta-isomerase-like uncharacterized protein